MDRRICAGMAALVALCCVFAPPAVAGTYNVHACGTSAGKFTNHSWEITVNGPQFTSGTCSASDARPSIWLSSSADNVYDPGPERLDDVHRSGRCDDR